MYCACVCVCMYVCKYACMHVCMYACMHVCIGKKGERNIYILERNSLEKLIEKTHLSAYRAREALSGRVVDELIADALALCAPESVAGVVLDRSFQKSEPRILYYIKALWS